MLSQPLMTVPLGVAPREALLSNTPCPFKRLQFEGRPFAQRHLFFFFVAFVLSPCRWRTGTGAVRIAAILLRCRRSRIRSTLEAYHRSANANAVRTPDANGE